MWQIIISTAEKILLGYFWAVGNNDLEKRLIYSCQTSYILVFHLINDKVAFNRQDRRKTKISKSLLKGLEPAGHGFGM